MLDEKNKNTAGLSSTVFFKKNGAGFTLVEILVSISIMLVMTTIVLANYRSANQKTSLNNAVQKLASDIRLAQQFALGEKEFNGSRPQGWGVGVLSAGLFSDTYYIYADLNGNDACYQGGSFDSPNEIYSKMKLAGATASDADQENIYISRLSRENAGTQCSASGTGISRVFINFEPPKPDTHLTDSFCAGHPCNSTGQYQKDLCITLKDARNNAVKTIRVNNVGLVEIID